ncbi:hypothetical protein BSM4216_3875 (plasmid) [Bacillus smithii]|nr:hypothetical protein [Bacillus smithii]AKP49020.1 hypothetical protein BSM4216_3875 [Bacillus smithii]
MITNKDYFAQLPKEIKQGFSELNIGYHLRKANITKLSGYSCLTVFKLIFLLVFQYKNWFRAFMSKRSQDLPGKDTVYRFLNTPTYHWRKFLLSLSSEMIRLLQPSLFVHLGYQLGIQSCCFLVPRCFIDGIRHHAIL